MQAVFQKVRSKQVPLVMELVLGVQRNKKLLQHLTNGDPHNYRNLVKGYLDKKYIEEMNNNSIPEHVRLSVKELLYEKVQKDHQEKAFEILKPSCIKPPLFVRVNKNIVDPKKLLRTFKNRYTFSCNIDEELDNCIKFDQYPELSLYELKEFKDGQFEIQDKNSQVLCSMIDTQPSDKILDYCAGAGGKALGIVDTLKEGEIHLFDINQKQLESAKRRFLRAKKSNVKFHKDIKALKKLKDTFDKVIVDAPCSTTGVMRRKPEIKQYFYEGEFRNKIYLQRDLLRYAKEYVKVGGKLYYFTCSLFEDENFNQIKGFLNLNQNFELLDKRNLFAYPKGGDGFFYAILRRKEQLIHIHKFCLKLKK